MKYKAQRKAEGWRDVTIWLSPEDVAQMEALLPHYEGPTALIRAALRALAQPSENPGQLPPQEPPDG